MKIDKVIVSSTKHRNYIDFWPIVAKAWKNLGIEPILIYTSSKKHKFHGDDSIINFHVKGVDPVFTAQNIRVLMPALFPNSVCLKDSRKTNKLNFPEDWSTASNPLFFSDALSAF